MARAYVSWGADDPDQFWTGMFVEEFWDWWPGYDPYEESEPKLEHVVPVKETPAWSAKTTEPAKVESVKEPLKDDAAKKLKQVSPLITFKVEGAYKIDGELTKLCKREGLQAIAHDDGSVGLYPASSGKRGKEWETYVDELRDAGEVPEGV